MFNYRFIVSLSTASLLMWAGTACTSDDTESASDMIADAADGSDSDMADVNEDTDVNDATDGIETDTVDADDVVDVNDGNDGNDTETVEVSDMENDVSPDPCATRPPLNLTSGFSMFYSNANPTEEVFTGTTLWIDAFKMPFPGDSGAAKRIQLQRDHYAVIEFDTSDVSSTFGRFDTDNPQITSNAGAKLMSISRCPGDFAAPIEDPDCLRHLGVVSNLAWSFDDRPFSCQIERNQQYYLNIVYTEDEGLPVDWTCSLAPEADDCMMLFNTTHD